MLPYMYMMMMIWLFSLSLAFCLELGSAAITLTRSVTEFQGQKTCNFAGEVLIGNPMSLHAYRGNGNYVHARLQQTAFHLIVDAINLEKCGIMLADGKNYSLKLETIDDESDIEKMTDIAGELVNRSQMFLIGTYGDDLTKPLAETAQASKRVLVTGGAVHTSKVFAEKDYVFGTLPAPSTFFRPVLEMLQAQNLSTIGLVVEKGHASSHGLCGSLTPEQLGAYNLEIVHNISLEAGVQVNEETIGTAITELAQGDPDAVISCLDLTVCETWLKTMKAQGYAPSVQIFTSPCIMIDEEEMFMNLEGVIGIDPWKSVDENGDPYKDNLLGWTKDEFHDQFQTDTLMSPDYETGAAASGLLIILNTIETLGTTNMSEVQRYLASHSFETFFGRTTFDENGQNGDTPLVFQYGSKLSGPNVVWPKDQVTGSLVFPLKSWDEKACLHGRNCSDVGVCLTNGTCDCPEGLEFVTPHMCLPEQVHNMQLSSSLRAFTIELFVVKLLFSLVLLLWVTANKHKPALCPPKPLYLLCVGSIISSSAILAHAMDDANAQSLEESMLGAYRPANFACQAIAWVSSTGDVLVFTALVVRLQNLEKPSVPVRLIGSFAAKLLCLVWFICLSWQLTDPLFYRREISLRDEYERPVKSAGLCVSEKGYAMIFTSLLFATHLIILGYGLSLCYRIWDFSNQDVIWTTTALVTNLQLALLSFPILYLLQDDPELNMVVRSLILFLNDVTVLVIIFVPKIMRRSKVAAASKHETKL